jgi:hypothetical protein
MIEILRRLNNGHFSPTLCFAISCLLVFARELWWLNQEWLELWWGRTTDYKMAAGYGTFCTIPPRNSSGRNVTFYRVFHLQRNRDYCTHTNANIKPLQLCCTTAAYENCLKSVRTQFQLFFSSMSSCHRQACDVSWHFVISQCTVVLFRTSLSGYTLLNASWTTANDFNAKYIRKVTHVLIVNTPYWQLNSHCATSASSGLATRVSLTRVSGERVGRVWYTSRTC